MYSVTDASESHYKLFTIVLITSIRGTDMQLIYHPRDINSKSAHSIVVNDSKILQKFLKVFSVEKTASLVKEFPAKHKDPNGQVKRKEGDVFNNGACSGQNVGEVKDGQTSYEVLEPEVKQKVQLTKQSMPRIHKGSTTSEAQEQMKFMSAVMYFSDRSLCKNFTASIYQRYLSL